MPAKKTVAKKSKLAVAKKFLAPADLPAPIPAPLKKVSGKPKIRVGKINARLGSAAATVVDLKKKFVARPAVPAELDDDSEIELAGNYYGSDVYDDDLDLGEEEEARADELLSEPVESLGELLDEEERLSYEEPAPSKAANRAPAAKPAIVKKTVTQATPTHFGVYKKLAVGFSVLVVVLAAVAAYFLLVKVKITLTLNDAPLNGEITATVYDRSADFSLPTSSVRGAVRQLAVEASRDWPVAGTEVIGEEVSGQMTIFNKYIKNQPLVATTRLLAADGKLFRLKNSVNVPAGGELVVEVYADQPQANLTVGAEHFVIPGLWEGLQDKIYAESQTGAISYKQKLKKIVSQSDIDTAVKELKAALIEQAQGQSADLDAGLDQKIYQLDESNLVSEVNAKVGEEREQINVKLKGTVVVVAYSNAAINSLAATQASGLLQPGQQLAATGSEDIKAELVKADADNKLAELKINFTAQAKVANGQELLDKRRLTNLSEAELKAYLDSRPDIAGYQLEFYPQFIRQTPGLTDRITIEVK